MLKDDGWEVAIVERWNMFAKIRQDLFGVADLLAMRPGKTPLLLQVTTTGVSSRFDNIINEPRALTALMSGFDIHIHGWRKIKVKRGGKAMKWDPRIIIVTKEDFHCL